MTIYDELSQVFESVWRLRTIEDWLLRNRCSTPELRWQENHVPDNDNSSRLFQILHFHPNKLPFIYLLRIYTTGLTSPRPTNTIGYRM